MNADGHIRIESLLTEPSPAFRRLVLTALLDRDQTDPEVCELTEAMNDDPLISGLSVDPKVVAKQDMRTTIIELMRLSYLGLDRNHASVAVRAEVLFAAQKKDGRWEHQPTKGSNDESRGYAMVPLRTALPLGALAATGYAEDPRCEAAYEWLLDKRLEDGTWPTGITSGVYGQVAGYRRLPHSRWGCGSNTTGALVALSYHPVRRHADYSRRALDLILGRVSKDVRNFGHDLGRRVGVVPGGGTFTYYGRFDGALVLELCARVGGAGDERIEQLAAIAGSMIENGLVRNPEHPQLCRWLTFDVLHSMKRLGEAESWIGNEPVTPYAAYPRSEKRY